MVKKFISKQFEIAKPCYASSKAVPNFGSLMISFRVHVINQAEKSSILKTIESVKTETLFQRRPMFTYYVSKMISSKMKFEKKNCGLVIKICGINQIKVALFLT